MQRRLGIKVDLVKSHLGLAYFLPLLKVMKKVYQETEVGLRNIEVGLKHDNEVLPKS
jgi:hypothetical protein